MIPSQATLVRFVIVIGAGILVDELLFKLVFICRRYDDIRRQREAEWWARREFLTFLEDTST